jgi:hypothetical protein
MIIISSGFPKSASTLLFLYTESLINGSGKTRGQKMFRRFNREGFTPAFNPLNAAWYVFASLFGPVVIKTHSGPCFSLRILIGLGLAKAYYSVRDPRDAVLSAMDHGEKARTQGIKTDSDVAFAPFKEWKDIYPAFHMHHKRFESWKKYGKVIFPRYELLMTQPDAELQKIVDFIGRNFLRKYIDSTVSAFLKNKTSTKNFNKGETSRYQTELNEQQIAALEKELRDCILSMDYKLHNT